MAGELMDSSPSAEFSSFCDSHFASSNMYAETRVADLGSPEAIDATRFGNLCEAILEDMRRVAEYYDPAEVSKPCTFVTTKEIDVDSVL